MSRMFASKSMFSSTMIGFETRSVINPVGIAYSTTYGEGICGSVSITKSELESLISIQKLYTSHIEDKTYTDIPVNFSQYLKLRNIAYNAIKKYKCNRALSLLFQITVDGITGAINAYGLNTSNTETKIQNIYLQTKINEIINGVNVTNAFDDACGTLSMKRTFKLAPLFQYYIRLHGFPQPGVGFDPVKLALILTIMENAGIDPYN